ncbi:hypothetical protein [Actinomadura chibensis]|uniref:Uncharacterized protein n=1 Tax=Actinomadura chibensis TaxID=392828 RepID=A0A5D0NLC7_9ACTN|nr:hypothetical protein [Actinomadura chibensis]TYB45300.1 hypothetical protein FXF69_17760 [Actinomadura chibensis]
MRMRVLAVTAAAALASGYPGVNVGRHRAGVLVVGALVAALLVVGAVIAFSHGVGGGHAALAPDGTAIGHNMAATPNGDGTAIGMGRY